VGLRPEIETGPEGCANRREARCHKRKSVTGSKLRSKTTAFWRCQPRNLEPVADFRMIHSISRHKLSSEKYGLQPQNGCRLP
jgi:hypothetical protein